MKLKGKLIMSAAALAACAATLTSTTYAWYTANTAVDANGVTGATANTGTSSIQIAKEKADKKNWSSLVNLTTNEISNYDQLTPLQYSTKESKDKADYQFTDLKGAPSTDGYLSFTLYFRTAKTSDNVPLYLKTFTATNANELKESDNLVYDSSVTADDWTKGLNSTKTSYSVDAVRCLGLVMDSTSLGTLKNKSYQVTEGTLKTESNMGESANALKYYNSLTSTSITEGTTGLTAGYNLIKVTNSNVTGEALKVADLNKDGEVTTITFKVYLDGWDQYCFDACKGQTINFNISFTSDAALALKY